MSMGKKMMNDDRNEAVLGIRAAKNQSTQVNLVTRKLEKSIVEIESLVDDLNKKVED